MISSRLAGLLLAALTLGGVGAVQALPAAAADTCDGVWVVVDYGSLGGTSTACATSYGTGTAALKSAGFNPTLDGGMITKISGKPSSPDISKAYWSYWRATKSDDGSYSDWSYSNLGANASHPTKGNAEGWRYQSLSDGKVPPAVAPPKGDTSTPTPTPSPTKTSTKPTKSPTPTKSATQTRSATASASKSATSSATPTATAASASAAATTAPVATPTSSDESTLSADEAATPVALEQQPAPDNGSPVGAMVAGGVVVVAGLGLGGWWLLKGRKP